MFYIKQHLPVLGRDVKYRELTNSQYFTLLKYLSNSDKQGIVDCFDIILRENLLDSYEDLTCIDKFLILLDIRSICVGDSIELRLETAGSAKLSLISIIESIKDKISKKKLSSTFNLSSDITINLKLPKEMMLTEVDKVIDSAIHNIIIGNQVYKIENFNEQEKNDFFQSLPANVYKQIIDFIEHIQQELKDICIVNRNEMLGIQEIPLNVFDGTLFAVLRTLYGEDLMGFYELQYSMIKKIGISYEHFMEMTPNESKLFINLYNRDIKQQEEASKKQNNSYMGDIPPFAHL